MSVGSKTCISISVRAHSASVPFDYVFALHLFCIAHDAQNCRNRVVKRTKMDTCRIMYFFVDSECEYRIVPVRRCHCIMMVFFVQKSHQRCIAKYCVAYMEVSIAGKMAIRHDKNSSMHLFLLFGSCTNGRVLFVPRAAA